MFNKSPFSSFDQIKLKSAKCMIYFTKEMSNYRSLACTRRNLCPATLAPSMDNGVEDVLLHSASNVYQWLFDHSTSLSHVSLMRSNIFKSTRLRSLQFLVIIIWRFENIMCCTNYYNAWFGSVLLHIFIVHFQYSRERERERIRERERERKRESKREREIERGRKRENEKTRQSERERERERERQTDKTDSDRSIRIHRRSTTSISTLMAIQSVLRTGYASSHLGFSIFFVAI